MIKRFNSESLNNIINELLDSMSKSKNKASKFHKVVTEKINIIEIELKKVNYQMKLLDTEIEKTSVKSKEYREKLMKVTKAMVENPEAQQSAYEKVYKKANELVFKMKSMESEYKTLFKKRDNLERELINLKEILVDAEDLIQSITTSFKYLNDDLSDVSNHLNEKEIILLKIIESGENEKKSIVRDIHDGPAQTLAYLTLEIQLLKSLIDAKNSENIIKKVEEIDRHIQGALEETRQIIHDLRPMSLDDLGLIPTLENYIKEFNESKRVPILFRLIDRYDLATKIPSALSVAVFRIIQEALNNVYKHSEATTATVSFEILNNVLKLKIIDNGKGFDVGETLRNIRVNGNFGLLGMKERVDLVDGEINIKSSKNSGTKIEVSIPWNFL